MDCDLGFSGVDGRFVFQGNSLMIGIPVFYLTAFFDLSFDRFWNGFLSVFGCLCFCILFYIGSLPLIKVLPLAYHVCGPGTFSLPPPL